jgi:hypothetical protein
LTNFVIRFSSSVLFSWHSHKTIGRHSRVRNALIELASRRLFPSILAFQYLTLLVGRWLPCLHRCPCQKQPCTKITAAYFGNTISGHPGKSLRCKRKRKPIRCSSERTNISGLVLILRTLAMTRLRSSGLSLSVIATDNAVASQYAGEVLLKQSSTVRETW